VRVTGGKRRGAWVEESEACVFRRGHAETRTCVSPLNEKANWTSATLNVRRGKLEGQNFGEIGAFASAELSAEGGEVLEKVESLVPY